MQKFNEAVFLQKTNSSYIETGVVRLIIKKLISNGKDKSDELQL